MKAKDYFSYDNPVFAPLKLPARDVVDAAQRANRFLDTVQEWFYIQAGMPETSRFVHTLAHKYPKLFDDFVEILHERHLEAAYPGTPELTEPIEGPDKAFEIIVTTLNELQEALEKFRSVTDNGELRSMAIQTEELMLRNSKAYIAVLEAWAMWDNGGSASSFDSWISEYTEED